jgi:hypothetical protein
MNLMHSNIGITDSIYAMLPSEDVKETIRQLGQNADKADSVSSVAIDQLATVLLQRMSELKGNGASI